MIEVRNLSKSFPGAQAVDNISFKIEQGEIIGFLGPNGAGKTTTMRILTSYFPPTLGTANVGGYDTVKDSFKVRKIIGYLPEGNPLYTEMRVSEYLTFRARLKGVGKKEVSKSMELVGLADQQRRIVGHLSKGYKQRVGMADAILNDPLVLILDEPTIGLDPNQIRQIRELIRSFVGKKTIILSTHILSEVELMCQRMMIINRGKLVTVGTPSQIATMLDISGKINVQVLGDGRTIKEQLESLPEVSRIIWGSKGELNSYTVELKNRTDIREKISNLAAQNKWRLVELSLEKLSLEDAFSRLTVGKEK